MTLGFSPNMSLLWADLPLPERFARAAGAGFGAVELWWPVESGRGGEDHAAMLEAAEAQAAPGGTGAARPEEETG